MANAEDVQALFPAMVDHFLPEKAADIKATILFDLSGGNGGCYWIKIADGAATTGLGEVSDPTLTVKASADDWHAVATGQLNAMQAFMTGKLKVLGDMGLAMKMQTIFGQ